MENNYQANNMPQNGEAINSMPPQWAPPPIGYQEPSAPRASVGKTLGLVAGTFVGYFVTQVIGGAICSILKLPEESSYLLQFVTALPTLIFMLVMLIVVMKKKKVLTVNGNGFAVGVLAGGYLVYGAIANLVNALFVNVSEEGGTSFVMPKGLHFGSEQIWCILAILVSAGICEELMFRGIILNALRDCFGRDTFKGTVASIFVSGALFGCMHFVNLTVGVPFMTVLVQVVSVCGMGFLMGAVYCRCGNIKVTIFLHFLLDICILLPNSMMTQSSISDALTDTISPMAFVSVVPYTVITIFLLRKSERHNLFNYSFEEDGASVKSEA